MQDTMAEKQVRVSIRTTKAGSRLLVPLLAILFFISCSEEAPRDEIPYTTFDDIYIQLNLPQYNDLSFNGGYIYLSEGLRGIILYRENATTYHAFERTCSYRPYEAGATIDVHASGLYLFDPSCKSTFSFDSGNPTGGPAQLPLREYTTELSGSTLIITDEPVGF